MFFACRERLNAPKAHIRVRTFGFFGVYLDDRLAAFKLAKSKEILACPADKQGSGVTRAELSAAVWEYRPYDRRM